MEPRRGALGRPRDPARTGRCRFADVVPGLAAATGSVPLALFRASAGAAHP